MTFDADNHCFACGPANPIGLHLTFRREGEVYVATFVADRRHQGYHGIVHGGILATLLDEIMARDVWERAGPAATARLEIRYRHPAPLDTPLDVRGWVTAIRRGGRAFETASAIHLPDGICAAEATGLVLRVDPSPR